MLAVYTVKFFFFLISYLFSRSLYFDDSRIPRRKWDLYFGSCTRVKLPGTFPFSFLGVLPWPFFTWERVLAKHATTTGRPPPPPLHHFPSDLIRNKQKEILCPRVLEYNHFQPRYIRVYVFVSFLFFFIFLSFFSLKRIVNIPLSNFASRYLCIRFTRQRGRTSIYHG